jgi:hypothetical protein
MPMSSAEIAAANNAFQQQAMQQAAFAQYGGQGPGIYGGGAAGGMEGERFMGGAMSRAGAIGAPVMMGAAALMGMDPVSLGLKTGIGAYGAGMGVGGAAMAAGAVMLPAMAFGAAAQHVGQQVFQGAQQAMALNSTLRGSYNFQNRAGGAGFERGEMVQISDMVRSMSESYGQGGEVTGFRELTQLAGKMGQMGFAQGVRDVKEFSTRFKEMVTSLKTMAKDLNTTLEGAMEFAAAAKQSGIFGMKGMQQFTHATILGAAATGFAVSEFTAAAQTGAQISRSVGGLGRQGAGAGIATMNQIGMAMKTGVLSEEDIYNATGLTGAEGRQAYASSQLQRAGNFYQSGRGRRMLASMAGKNGQLDEVGVQELLAGGMGISETMSRDNKMKSTVGRANFIRNEGRLRGAAMERLGGLGPVMQMKQWMESKGINLAIDSDRAALFLQRQMGLGRDEADDVMKQMQNLPQQLAELRVSQENKGISDDIGVRNKQKGIEGIKNRFEQAKNEVNNKFQKVGAAIFDEGSRQLDEFFAHLSGRYTETMNDRADKAYRAYMSGNQSSFKSAFGAGAGGLSMRTSAGSFADFSRGSVSNGGAEDPLARLLYGESMQSKYEKAGFSFAGVGKMVPGAAQDSAMRARMAEIERMSAAANGRPSADLIALGAKNSSWMNKFYAQSLGGLGGDERLNRIEEEFHTRAAAGDKGAIEVVAKLDAAKGNSAVRARIIAGVEESAGVSESARLGKGGFLDAGAGKLGGTQETRSAYQRRMALALGIGNDIMSKGLGDIWHDTFGGGQVAKLAAAGTLLDSPDMQDMQRDMFSSDKRTRAAAMHRVSDELNKLNAKGVEQTDSVKGQKAVYQSMLAVQEMQDAGGAITEEKAAEILKRNGLSQGNRTARETLQGMADVHTGGGAALGNAKAAAQYAGARAADELSSMTKMGIASIEVDSKTGKQGVRISAATKENLSKIKGGTQALMLAMSSLNAETEYGTGDPREKMRNIAAKRMEESQAMAGMSDEDVEKMSTAFAGTDIGRRYAETGAGRKRISMGLKRGGAAGGIGAGLGLTLSNEEKKVFNAKSAKGDEAYRNQLEQMEGLLEKELSVSGTKDEGLKSAIKNYAIYTKAGDVKHGEEALKTIESNEEVQKAQKEKNMAQQEAADPLQAAVKKNTEEMAGYLKQLTEKGVRVSNPDDIGKKKDDPENKNSPTPDKNAGASGR